MAEGKRLDLKRWVVSGTRVRFTRKRDAKAAFGWIQSIDGKLLYLESGLKLDFAHGDQFFLEIHGSGLRALCDTVLDQIRDETHLRFFMVTDPKVLESDQQIRVQVDRMPGAITQEENRTPIQAVDISPNGIGIISPVHARKGDVVTLEIKSEGGVIGCTAEVRYCRPLTPEEEEYKFRIGLQFKEIGRLDLARFHKLFDQAA